MVQLPLAGAHGDNLHAEDDDGVSRLDLLGASSSILNQAIILTTPREQQPRRVSIEADGPKYGGGRPLRPIEIWVSEIEENAIDVNSLTSAASRPEMPHAREHLRFGRIQLRDLIIAHGFSSFPWTPRVS
ncbi:hypothetical protein GCM10009081_07680 [Brevundimonas nasdae]